MANLSNPAKMLRHIMAKTGVHDTKELAEILDIPVRTIQRLKLEVAVGSSANGAINGAANDATSAMDGATGAANDATNGASTCNRQKEIPPTPPKEKYTTTQNYPNQPPLDARDAEPAAGGLSIDWPEIKSAFNGSTRAMVEEVDRAMGGNCRREAETWLANLLRLHGQQPVAEAYHVLLTNRAQGAIVPKPLAFWSATAKKRAEDARRAPPPPAKSKIPTHMQRY